MHAVVVAYLDRAINYQRSNTGAMAIPISVVEREPVIDLLLTYQSRGTLTQGMIVVTSVLATDGKWYSPLDPCFRESRHFLIPVAFTRSLVDDSNDPRTTQVYFLGPDDVVEGIVDVSPLFYGTLTTNSDGTEMTVAINGQIDALSQPSAGFLKEVVEMKLYMTRSRSGEKQ